MTDAEFYDASLTHLAELVRLVRLIQQAAVVVAWAVGAALGVMIVKLCIHAKNQRYPFAFLLALAGLWGGEGAAADTGCPGITATPTPSGGGPFDPSYTWQNNTGSPSIPRVLSYTLSGYVHAGGATYFVTISAGWHESNEWADPENYVGSWRVFAETSTPGVSQPTGGAVRDLAHLLICAASGGVDAMQWRAFHRLADEAPIGVIGEAVEGTAIHNTLMDDRPLSDYAGGAYVCGSRCQVCNQAADCNCDGTPNAPGETCAGCPGDCDCDGTLDGPDPDLCSGCPDDADCDGIPNVDDPDLPSGCPDDADCDGVPDADDPDPPSGCADDCDCDGAANADDADLCSGCPDDADCDGVRDEDDPDLPSGCPDDADCDGVHNDDDPDPPSGCADDCDCDGIRNEQDSHLCSGCPDDADCDGIRDEDDPDPPGGCDDDCDCDGIADEDEPDDLCSGCVDDFDCDGVRNADDANNGFGCTDDCDCDGIRNGNEGPPDPSDPGTTCCNCEGDQDCDGVPDGGDSQNDGCEDCPEGHDPFDPKWCHCDADGDGCLNCNDKNPDDPNPGDCCPRNHDCTAPEFAECDFDGDGCKNGEDDAEPGACANPDVGCDEPIGGGGFGCDCDASFSELWQSLDETFGEADPLPRVFDVNDRTFSISIPIVNPFTGTPLVDPSLTSFEFDYLFTDDPALRSAIDGIRLAMRGGLLFLFSLGAFFRAFSIGGAA